jgi:hypothetical protein
MQKLETSSQFLNMFAWSENKFGLGSQALKTGNHNNNPLSKFGMARLFHALSPTMEHIARKGKKKGIRNRAIIGHDPATSNQRNGVALQHLVFLPTSEDEDPRASPNTGCDCN